MAKNENPFELISMPASREPVSLLAVARAQREQQRPLPRARAKSNNITGWDGTVR